MQRLVGAVSLLCLCECMLPPIWYNVNRKGTLRIGLLVIMTQVCLAVKSGLSAMLLG